VILGATVRRREFVTLVGGVAKGADTTKCTAFIVALEV
jgi:hypothetical protein